MPRSVPVIGRGAGYEAVRRIRHWFAWPGAALAALRLLDDAGRLEAALGVRRR